MKPKRKVWHPKVQCSNCIYCQWNYLLIPEGTFRFAYCDMNPTVKDMRDPYAPRVCIYYRQQEEAEDGHEP